ncbi:MAG: hypothetical protein Q7T83_01550 [Thermodesulfovibrionales bacterium]|nr:hypothetical protein [Thermodesulfovibrionales bacterium]MDP3259491.1 hypothetical protein [Thermodesulfovibrionales bacterium]
MRYYSLAFVFLIFGIFLAAPTQAAFQFKTKDGVTFTWLNFSLTENGYCTLKNGGKFCIPASNIVSIKEVDSDASVTSTEKETSSAVGVMNKNFSRDSGDGHLSGSGHSGHKKTDGYYNREGSTTSYTKEITDADVRRLELEEAANKQAAEQRQREKEQKEYIDKETAKAKEHEEKQEAAMEKFKEEAGIGGRTTTKPNKETYIVVPSK